MDTIQLEIKVKELIVSKGIINTCEIPKIVEITTPEDKKVLSSIISKLIFDNAWKTEHIKGRLFINTESAVDKTKETTITHRKNSEVVDSIVPKCIPANGDWVVTSVSLEVNDRLFFDACYNRTDVRHAFSKVTKSKFENVRAKIYHKITPLKSMHNFI